MLCTATASSGAKDSTGSRCESWCGRSKTAFVHGRRARTPGAPIALFSRLASFFPLVRLLHISAGFLDRALGIVVGLDGLAVFIDCAFALPGCVENLAQLQVAPNLGPSRLTIAIQRFAVGVRRGLIILLQEKHFGDPVVGQRTVFVDFERFVELAERSRQIALLGQSLSARDG